MRRFAFGLSLALILVWSAPTLWGFCGFYVSKADTKIYNEASQVVLVRDGDRTVMTMVNDFKGDVKDFAVVIPVPTFLQREQIHVGDKKLVDHVDAYSAPRLVEYFDENPCNRYRFEAMKSMAAPASAVGGVRDAQARSLGVTIEAKYTVGEYDILILSAEQSTGLETWLLANGYKIPAGASAVLGSYIRQNMRFFVAKVNVTEQTKLGFSYLRPLQVAYESPKFMLPIRLGTVNASGSQELFVYALTRKGRVETTNYRTVKLPSDMELPEYLKDPHEFTSFYKAMFSRQLAAQDRSVLFTEYAWDMRWCDPCAADPLSPEELRHLGVFWSGADGSRTAAPDVFLTRLHVRYDRAHFPEDLVFQETADRNNFQGRYVLRHAWTGNDACSAVAPYRASLKERHEQEVTRLASLTGWRVEDIRKKAGVDADGPAGPWWEKIWKH
ncbi:MAG TPA: DUF2330 domain-containing protein [Vicinamibacterales bacterium]|nr:DUF2330 domain-containing protein [Vicinamibacterales bacterium]